MNRRDVVPWHLCCHLKVSINSQVLEFVHLFVKYESAVVHWPMNTEQPQNEEPKPLRQDVGAVFAKYIEDEDTYSLQKVLLRFFIIMNILIYLAIFFKGGSD